MFVVGKGLFQLPGAVAALLREEASAVGGDTRTGEALAVLEETLERLYRPMV